MSTDNPTPKPRSIDERLEGLTQTVEIIAAMQRDNERRFAANEERFTKILGGLERLTLIAESHERRM
jgi:hypothetical protein